MNILFLTTKFPIDPSSPYLTNELCSALIDLKHAVTVVNIDWHDDNKGKEGFCSGSLRVVNVPPLRLDFLPRLLTKSIAWGLSSLRAYLSAAKYLRGKQFDAVVITSPLTIFALFLLAGFQIKGARVALCWDFFPFHQVKIGLLPHSLSPVLKRVEEIIYNSCSHIYVLSEDYRLFLLKNYRISSRTEIAVSGLWGGALPGDEEAGHELPSEFGNKVIVFGGQFISGRGTGNFLQLCRAAAKIDGGIRILLLGRGEVLGTILDMARSEGITNLCHMAPVPRARYVRIISGCMAGFVSLDGDTGCPSFPSKIVDYSRAGLPVIVIDNTNPDLKEFIESREMGFYLLPDDISGLESALSLLAGDPDARRRMSENSRGVYSEEFNAGRVASLIVSKLSTEH